MDKTVIKIKLTTCFPKEPIARQTPQNSGVWSNCQFLVDQEVDECDFWVVYEGLLRDEKTLCPKQNTIFITGEPPSTRKYDPRFLGQFAVIITCHADLKHPNMIFTQQGFPWHVGRRVVQDADTFPFTLDYDRLKAIDHFQKDKLISVISSAQLDTRGHKRRLSFVQMLGNHYDSGLDIFGRGIRFVEDKWDAIARYQYHIVVENEALPDYWTEKLADAYLGGAYPFYYGCLNLSDYFPSGAYTPIDIEDPEGAISTIKHAIQNEQYTRSLNELKAARELVLDRYNLFSMLSEICNRFSAQRRKVKVVLKPESVRSLRRKVQRKLLKVLRPID